MGGVDGGEGVLGWGQQRNLATNLGPFDDLNVPPSLTYNLHFLSVFDYLGHK